MKVEPVNEEKDVIKLCTRNFKSNCRHSGLPDWATVYIDYKPNDLLLNEESLYKYLISYRNHKEFHEECCERILFDLINVLKPEYVKVQMQYTRRGGLDINPIRWYYANNYTINPSLYSLVSNFQREPNQ